MRAVCAYCDVRLEQLREEPVMSQEAPMCRRRFLRSAAQSGAAIGLTCFADAARRPAAAAARPEPSGKASFRDVGWVWEGQGIDRGVPPSIYGLGQGARYFGLSRANYLFHPNDEHALRLLSDYKEVTCDISKWGWEWNASGRPKCVATSDPATVSINVTAVSYNERVCFNFNYKSSCVDAASVQALIACFDDALDELAATASGSDTSAAG